MLFPQLNIYNISKKHHILLENIVNILYIVLISVFYLKGEMA